MASSPEMPPTCLRTFLHSLSPAPRTLRRAAASLGVLALPLAATAQDLRPGAATRDSAPAVASGGSLFRRSDAAVLAAFGAGAAIAYHNDRGIAHAFQRPGVQDNRALSGSAAVFRVVGQPGVLVGGVAAYGIGRLTHRRGLAAAGLHVSEAIAAAGVLTAAGKYVAGRSRPFVTDDQDPGDFQLWRGHRRGFTSMPSGHTSAAFAAASALAIEWRAAAPGSARFGAPLAYAGAALVGASRVYHNRHWASDVVAGAALGTLSGVGVERLVRAHPDNALERHLVALQLIPSTRGIAVAYSW